MRFMDPYEEMWRFRGSKCYRLFAVIHCYVLTFATEQAQSTQRTMSVLVSSTEDDCYGSRSHEYRNLSNIVVSHSNIVSCTPWMLTCNKIHADQAMDLPDSRMKIVSSTVFIYGKDHHKVNLSI